MNCFGLIADKEIRKNDTEGQGEARDENGQFCENQGLKTIAYQVLWNHLGLLYWSLGKGLGDSRGKYKRY
jgi:hypothetical protein